MDINVTKKEKRGGLLLLEIGKPGPLVDPDGVAVRHFAWRTALREFLGEIIDGLFFSTPELDLAGEERVAVFLVWHKECISYVCI